MLYNPKWDFYTLAGLRDWLAKQPADETYSWQSCRRCVVGQYLEAHGHSPLEYSWWCEQADPSHIVGRSFAVANTFGEALRNLDANMAAIG